jgi:lipid II:glycine glycyltransferase (peptidoglycan interpeptide bridge formation enzyme)
MYRDLMHEIGWKTEIPGDSQLYYRSLGPLTIAKIQRPKSLDLAWLKTFRQKYKTLTTYIEPSLTSQLPEKRLGFHVEPFAHSSTSLIDLRPTEPNILNSFSQKTRYNIVHSLKKAKVKIKTVELGKLSDKQLADFFALHAEWSKQKNVIGYS